MHKIEKVICGLMTDLGLCKKLPQRLLLCRRCANFASMQVSVELLKEWFADFNVRYFGGSLPVPAFAVGRSRTQLGCMSCKVRRRMFSKSYTDYTIRLSNYYDADERHFKSVLLHEMIHLCITSRRIKDTSPHGEVFRRMMRAINADGWSISVSTKMDAVQRSAGKARKRMRVVLAVAMTDGRCLLSVVSPRYVPAIDKTMSRARGIVRYDWYVSDDDFFSSFPSVRTPRGRIVGKDMFAELTGRMKPLDRVRAGISQR